METKTCIKCGETKFIDQFHQDKSKKDGHVSKCKTCARRHTREWYRSNRDKALNYQCQYQRDNYEEIRKYQKTYREVNSKEIYEVNKKWVEANPEKVKRTKQKYANAHREELNLKCHIKRQNNLEESRKRDQQKRDRNRENVRESLRSWKKRNRDKVHIDSQNRRAKESGAPGKYSLTDVRRMLVLQGEKCVYHKLNPRCLVDLKPKFHVDHIVPLFRGGSNYLDNLQLLCHFCNESKGVKTDQEYRNWLANIYSK